MSEPRKDVNKNVDASSKSVNPYVDDEDEIIGIAESLSRGRLYGAAQMIYQLSRERDEARAALSAALAR
jgi:hypothetical protein